MKKVEGYEAAASGGTWAAAPKPSAPLPRTPPLTKEEALLDVGDEAGGGKGGDVEGGGGGGSYALKPSAVRKLQRESMGLAPEMPRETTRR